MKEAVRGNRGSEDIGSFELYVDGREGGRRNDVKSSEKEKKRNIGKHTRGKKNSVKCARGKRLS